MDIALPPFRPHRLLPGGHAQTLAGIFLPWRQVKYAAQQRHVKLPDGDAVVLHDDCSPHWQPGERIVLLMHGLAGCHLSPYMIRIAGKLCDRGVRTFRMDLRGCGAGQGLARRPYHAGRTDDVAAVVEFLLQLCPDSPICLVGFSLSGNVVLKYLGESPEQVPPQLDRAMAVNPPIDLAACVTGLERWSNRLYDRHFVSILDRQLRLMERRMTDFAIPESYRRPRRLFDFDDLYTAPVAGFGNAETYYTRCSAAQFVPHIRTQTLIVTARDDPLVPFHEFDRLTLPAQVSLHVAQHGGHLGYIARGGFDPDRRWLDWRVVDWATHTRQVPGTCP